MSSNSRTRSRSRGSADASESEMMHEMRTTLTQLSATITSLSVRMDGVEERQLASPAPSSPSTTSLPFVTSSPSSSGAPAPALPDTPPSVFPTPPPAPLLQQHTPPPTPSPSHQPTLPATPIILPSTPVSIDISLHFTALVPLIFRLFDPAHKPDATTVASTAWLLDHLVCLCKLYLLQTLSEDQTIYALLGPFKRLICVTCHYRFLVRFDALDALATALDDEAENAIRDFLANLLLTLRATRAPTPLFTFLLKAAINLKTTFRLQTRRRNDRDDTDTTFQISPEQLAQLQESAKADPSKPLSLKVKKPRGPRNRRGGN